MINTIEKMRIKENYSKARLARELGISTKQYYNYLNGSEIPYKIVENVCKLFGYEIAIVIKLE